MKFLSLNCQHGEQPGLESFLKRLFDKHTYDIFLLQEVDNKVFSFLDHPSYKVERPFNKETGKAAQVCLVYKASYNFVSTGFQPFASMNNDAVYGFKHPAMGMVWADFQLGTELLRVACIHLHPGLKPQPRLRELKLTKSLLLQSNVPVVLAGDFNSGFPWEPASMYKVLAPELSWMTKNLGPTLNSMYSESVAALASRTAALLRFFNLAIYLRTDHIFIDFKIANKFSIHCSVLSDRVSDHSPVEVVFDPILAEK